MIRISRILDRLGCYAAADRLEMTMFRPAANDDPWSDEFWEHLEENEPQGGNIACPDCGGPMALKSGPYSHFWGCLKFPLCKGTYKSRPDGTPIGPPTTTAVKRARMTAHEVFDRLWKGPDAPMNRGMAYKWMQKELGMDESRAHIGNFSVEECEDLIRRVGMYFANLSPEDIETEKMRTVVAKLMRSLYAGANAPLTRQQAYQFMSEKLRLSPDQSHVSQLSLQQCKKMTGYISELKRDLERRSSFSSPNVRLAMPPYGYGADAITSHRGGHPFRDKSGKLRSLRVADRHHGKQR